MLGQPVPQYPLAGAAEGEPSASQESNNTTSVLQTEKTHRGNRMRKGGFRIWLLQTHRTRQWGTEQQDKNDCVCNTDLGSCRTLKRSKEAGRWLGDGHFPHGGALGAVIKLATL